MGALLVIAAAGAASSCSVRETPPSILLIVADTLRADHLGCYGYERNTSPRIDELSRTATLYRRAMASAPWTVPTHASIFTGLYPFEHGAHSCKLDSHDECVRPLHEDHITLAEVLREAGYRTAAFVANEGYLNSGFQLDQGFETWTAERVHAPGINARAIRWIRQTGARPFFLFLNYMDTHRVYNTTPQPNLADLPVVADSGELLDELIERALPAEAPVPPDLVRRVVAQYDMAVANVDAAIGALLDQLRRLDLDRRTLVVLTSDHGEYFGEHQLAEHSKDIYQPALWVPLIVRSPGQTEGREVLMTASSTDLPHLVISHLPESMAQGYLPRFPDAVGNHAVISENYYTRPNDLYHETWGHRFDRIRTAIFDWPYKLIRSSDGRHELYDLERDPGETTNLFDVDTTRAARLAGELEEFQVRRLGSRDIPEGALHPAELDEDLRRTLRSLGYLD